MRTCLLLLAATVVAACAPHGSAPLVEPAEAPTPTEPALATAAPSASPTALTVTTKSAAARAAFDRAMELRDGARWPEAYQHFKKAAELDPDFALAHAFAAVTASVGQEGEQAAQAAVAHLQGLPLAERAAVEALVATQRNELDRALAAWRRVTELVPGDWRGHAELSILAFEWMRKYDLAEPAARKAVELNPRSAWAYNNLGYTLIKLNRVEEGIAALTKAVELCPNEPNPRDSLADAFLQAGRLAEAEASFAKAVELLPSFSWAWSALGQTRGLRGDWQGASEAFAQGIASATTPQARAAVRLNAAMALLAQGKKVEALQMLDEREGEAKTGSPEAYASSPVDKALVHVETGEAAKAVTLLDEGLARADTLGRSGPTTWLRSRALGLKVKAQAMLKRHADAEQSLAAYEAFARQSADDPYIQSELHWARAELLLSKGDAKAAVSEIALCVPEDPIAQRTRVTVLEQVGDKAGAEAARQLLAKPLRNPLYLVARGKHAALR